jgi:DNA-cytosine methyltransferase
MYKVLDLFSGIGGFSLGLERTGGFETVAFCEIEKFPQKVLSKHWPGVPIYEDVRELTAKQLRTDGIIPNVITGGFPCQDISISGKGKGITGEKSGLWFEYKRIINELQPRYAIVENVSALLGRGLSVILGGLAEIGYDATWTVYDSRHFGVPQRRRRVYILAVRDGITPESDIFQANIRSYQECRRKVEDNEKLRKRDIEKRDGERDSFAFFTRQRSDEFAEIGLSSTLAKRDYKSFTDIVMENGYLRRVTPRERMLFQGFPADWMDDLGGSDKDLFACNGMTAGVVTHIGERVIDYDRA